MRGLVFSVEEFATFDGPGIRMTVFMKGCPLSCSWCHNPEGQSFLPEYLRSPNGCIRCGRCESTVDGKTVLTEASIAACPRSLVRRCGTEYETGELCEKLLKNAALLNMNGGGVTFSGGEPLAQADFVFECMQALKGRLHLALQTSGYVKTSGFARALELSDYFLYDLKLMDPSEHKSFCGVDNELIKKNYAALARSGVPFVTRVPLIPAVTDTEKNLTDIARFMHENGVSYAELLPYNKLAGSKYGSVLKVYEPGFDESIEPKPHDEIFSYFGIETRIM